MMRSGSGWYRVRWLEHIRGDLSHAGRTIIKMPVLAFVVIVSLGIGIGVNTAVFSWIQAVVLQPLPGVQDAASFYSVEPLSEAGTYPGTSWLEYRDMRERVRSFRDLLAFRMVAFNVGVPAQVERTYGQLVSANYFSALGLRPALGRFFFPDEGARPGSAPVAVISHGYWQTRYGGARNVLGQTIRVNERELTIVGVAPPRFQGTVLVLSFDLWVPATMAPVLLGGSNELEDRTARGYAVMGHLVPNARPEQAQLELDAAMSSLSRIFAETNGGMKGQILPFWKSPHGPQQFLTRGLVILQSVMLLLLMVVCANTANLMLARASARQREIGVRRALGASRWRIVTLLLTENVLLALGGATLGACIAIWASEALLAVPMIGAFPIKFQTSIDGLGLAYAATLGVACGLIFGAVPALQLSRIDPQVALRSGLRSMGRSRLRNALMGVEVALALLVLVVAGIFVRRMGETRDTDPGFRREGTLLAAYDVTGRNMDRPAALELAATVLERVRALPGIGSAAIATSVPLDIHGLPLRSFALEGRARNAAGSDQALSNIVTPDYFRTMGIQIRAGTDFGDLRDVARAPQAIVNEEFVRRFVDKGEAIGRRIDAGNKQYTIIGVVKNSVYDEFGEPPTPIIYYSYRDRAAASGQIHLRASVGTEMTIVPELRRVMREIDPTISLYDVRTLNEHVERNLFLKRIPARMFVVLGPLLLMLAAIGIYAVVAYTVARRTGEIGVRLALGATASRVVAQIVAESVRVASIGGAVGWLLAFLVYIHAERGKPLDPSVFVGVPVLLLAVTAFSSWLPARRASKIDPLSALRQE